MHQPLVSVTICTYNGELFLRQLLDSLIKLNYSNIEFIFVDDGSTDSTLEILKEFADKHSTVYIYTQHNQGLASARNHAFARANGTWICVIDQDDIIYPDRISDQLRVASDYPSASLIFGNTHHIDHSGNIIGEHLSGFDLPCPPIPNLLSMEKLLLHGCFIDSEAWFFKKSLYESAGPLKVNLRYSCDFEYFLRLCKLTDLAFTTLYVGAWRQHPGQSSAQYPRIRSEWRRVVRPYLFDNEICMPVRLKLLIKLLKSSIFSIFLLFRR